MQTHFEKCLTLARRRWVAELLLGGLGDVLLVAGLVVAAAIACERVFDVSLVTRTYAAAAAGCGAAVLLLMWLLKRPTRAEVALLIDDRIALRERFSTTLAMAASTDPFAVAAREECYARAEKVDVSGHFPIRPGRRWAWAAGAWVVAGLVFLSMPTLDLFGRQAEVQRLASEQKKADAAAAEIKKVVSKVQVMIKPLDAPDVAKDLATLAAELKGDMGSADVRREAIRTLGSISDKLSELGGGKNGETTKMIQSAVKQLKSPPGGLTRKLSQSMARGKFGDAAEAIKDLKDKVAGSEMSDADKAEVAKELENLGNQLQALANSQKNMADALAAAGADPSLAAKSGDDLKNALEQAGLDAKTIQKLMQNQQANQAAQKALGDLAKSLGKCSGGGAGGGGQPSPEAMQALGDQLSQLEAMRQEMALAKATIDELHAEMAKLGQGLGGTGEFGEGAPNQQGGGTGGPGKGFGPRDTSDGEVTNMQGSRVANQNKSGPVIATWMSQEDQEVGKATRDFESNLQAAKDRASEAISENVIPSRYHGPVTKYFETVGQPDEPREKK
jgi:hypothetical protein